MITIYGIFEGRKCVYIGQSINPAKRWDKHKRSGRFSLRCKIRALRIVSEAEAVAAERAAINDYKARGHGLMNVAKPVAAAYRGEPIKCIETGEVFRSRTELARSLRCQLAVVSGAIRSDGKLFGQTFKIQWTP